MEVAIDFLVAVTRRPTLAMILLTLGFNDSMIERLAFRVQEYMVVANDNVCFPRIH